jgi:antitoxin VapB
LENELVRIEREKAASDPVKTLAERIKPIQDRVVSRPATGLEADKAFYDDLSGDL